MSKSLVRARDKARATFQNEPVVVNAVRAVVVLLAAVGINVDNGAVDTVINVGSLAFAAWSIYNARSKVSPVDEA